MMLYNVALTSTQRRCCIDVDATLLICHVTAGYMVPLRRPIVNIIAEDAASDQDLYRLPFTQQLWAHQQVETNGLVESSGIKVFE